MSRYFDRQGVPIGALEWAYLFEQPDRVIAKTDVNGLRVSTVWLGIDHSFGGAVPLIFETMVFPDERHVERYSTEAEARAGHERIVEMATTGAFGVVQ